MVYLGVGMVAVRPAGHVGSTSHRAVRAARRRHPVVLRRRLRDRARVPARPVRHLPGRRDPRPAAHRLVGRRRRRAADHQRVPRRAGQARHADRRRVPAGAVHHGRRAGRRVRRQPADPAGRREVPRERCDTRVEATARVDHDDAAQSTEQPAPSSARVAGSWLLIVVLLGYGVEETLKTA